MSTNGWRAIDAFSRRAGATGGRRRLRHPATAAAMAACLALAAGACGSSSSKSSGGTAATTATTTATTAASPSTSAAAGSTGSGGSTTGTTLPEWSPGGTLPKGEPDLNHDGKVLIGVLSPGDIHDHGYYESFVDDANTYANQQGWKLIEVSNVADANAQREADDLCRQHVDMVALGAGELADGLAAANDSVCKGVFFYINGASTVKQAPYFTQSLDSENQSGAASGIAAGILMKQKGYTKAGFIAGTQASFNTDYYIPWAAGLKTVVPNASTTITYTGDENDSAKAVEAFKALQSQGVQLVYPYLGGSTDAVATLANKANIPVLTPGTDRCGQSNPSFAISVNFSPGDYFLGALQQFKAGSLRLGVTRNWRMGVDPYPTVKFCQPTGTMAQQLATAITEIGNGTIDVNKLASGK